MVVSVDGKFVVESTNEHPYHRTVYSYSKADWDGSRVHLRYVPWLDIFKHDATYAAKEITEWVEIGIDCYIPLRKFQLKSHSSPWFTPYAAAIPDRNHYFHKYHWNATPENKKLFCDSCNHCRIVLKDARYNYAETTGRSVSSQLIVSLDFWRICNSVLNRGKSTIPPLFYGLDVLTIFTDKANLFASYFSCNSTLNGSQQLTDFRSRAERRLSSKNITAKWFLMQSTILMHSKPLAPTEFQPLSLRCTLQSFLLFLLRYTINDWPNLAFLPVRNLHWLCQFLKMMERDLLQVSIVL